jgi:hypothetical protein
MTAVVVVSSACAGVFVSAAQASPVGSQGLVPTQWSCSDVNGNAYYAYVSLPAAFNAPVPAGGRATRSFPGILTAYIPTNPVDPALEPALPLGPYHVLPAVSPPNKNGIVTGTVLSCNLVVPVVPGGVFLMAAYAGG